MTSAPHLLFPEWNVGDRFVSYWPSKKNSRRTLFSYIRDLNRNTGIITARSETPDGRVIPCNLPLSHCEKP